MPANFIESTSSLGSNLHTADEQLVRSLLQNLLHAYITPSFGPSSRAEFDILVIEALQAIGYLEKEPTIFELISKLGITRHKARKLVYEQELLRRKEVDFTARLQELLLNPIIQKEGAFFLLEVQSPLFSDYVREQLRALKQVSDGSFSPNIIKLTLKGYQALVESIIPPDNRETVRRALIDAGAPDASLSGVLTAALRTMAAKILSDTGDAAFDAARPYMTAILDGKVRDITRSFKTLFKTFG